MRLPNGAGQQAVTDPVTRNLLECWTEVAGRLRKAEAMALFLDFDGTLAPCAPRPEQARLPEPTREVLQRLVRLPSLKIWVISGRQQADVRDQVGVPDIRYLGLYGWEDGRIGRLSEPVAAMVVEARATLIARLKPVEGVWVEDKGAVFVLHFRGASADSVRHAEAALHQVLGPFGAGLHVIEDDRAWAVAPREIEGKGKVAHEQWRAFDAHALPVYAGDGVTDEPAFEALAEGITVCVGPRQPTHAHYRLRGPDEVRTFLERLEAECR